MKFIIRACIILGLATMVSQAATKEDFSDQKKRLGYGLGAGYGRSLKQNNIDVDLEAFLQGMKDFIKGESLMNDEERQNVQVKIKLSGECLVARFVHSARDDYCEC